MDFLQQHIDKQWSWITVAQYNPNFTMEFVLKNLNIGWSWRTIFKCGFNKNRTEYVEQKFYFTILSTIYEHNEMDTSCDRKSNNNLIFYDSYLVKTIMGYLVG